MTVGSQLRLGYHTVHHINSRLHWTQLPGHFIENVDNYVKNDAIVFQGIGFFEVGLFVKLGMFKKLASHFVHLGGKRRSEEELIAMFKERLQPIYYDQEGNVHHVKPK